MGPNGSNAISAAAGASLAASMPSAQFSAFTAAPVHMGNVNTGRGDSFRPSRRARLTADQFRLGGGYQSPHRTIRATGNVNALVAHGCPSARSPVPSHDSGDLQLDVTMVTHLALVVPITT